MYGFIHSDLIVKRELGKNDDSSKLSQDRGDLNSPIDKIRSRSDGKFYPKAPSDLEQVRSISNCLSKIDGLRFDNWRYLSSGERLHILQAAECEIAKISLRRPCEVKLKKLSTNNYGSYSRIDKIITLNTRYINDSSYASYKNTLETLFHEGRHAYQDYNLTERQVHTSPGDLTNWRVNENKYGYQSAHVFGYKLYWMQPVEADARKFAEDVFTKFSEKA